MYLGLPHKPVRQLLRESCYRDWSRVLNKKTVEGTFRVVQYVASTVLHT
jgi:hypothetical protein